MPARPTAECGLERLNGSDTMPIQIKADSYDPGRPLEHFWSFCVGAGRANEGLRAGWLEQLRTVVNRCGFRYVRFHGLFHDDMFVYRVVDGKDVYNFQYVDDLFDRLLDHGIRPFVEFGFCPGDLATEKATVFWWGGHGSPPKDYAKWAELISRTVRHWVDRYGIDEVKEWYFEVWNEPNLNPFFRGTKGQYFELYRVSVEAVKAVDARLRVGGPATSNFVPDARFDGETEDVSVQLTAKNPEDLDNFDWKPVWVSDFLAFCEKGGLPVDFVSCHPYPTDWALDSHGTNRGFTRNANATKQDLTTLRNVVDASAYPDAEIHLTEWSSSSSPRDNTHDFLQAATFVVKANVESAGLVDSLSYWTFTDVFEEGGAGDTAFHGGFGMINYQGIVKPTFHAYRFLNLLGDETVATGAGAIVTRHTESGRLTALAYHYPPEVPMAVPASMEDREAADRVLETGGRDELVVELTGLRPRARFTIETLGRQNGDAMSAWVAMGAPEPLSIEDAQLLKHLARATRRESITADDAGTLAFRRPIEPWNVVLIRETDSAK